MTKTKPRDFDKEKNLKNDMLIWKEAQQTKSHIKRKTFK